MLPINLSEKEKVDQVKQNIIDMAKPKAERDYEWP